MSGLFHRLASRAMGNVAIAEPIVPSVFAPVAHTGHLEMTSERTEVAIRPANVSSTLPSIEPSQAENAVHKAFDANHPRDREPDRSVEPQTARSSEPAKSQPTTPAVRRALPQLINPIVPLQHVIDQSADRPAPQRPAQFLPAATPTQMLPRATRREGEQPDSSSPNVIRVSIGRIDVRAELPAPPSAPPPRQRPSGMSLDDYAKLRAEGKR